MGRENANALIASLTPSLGAQAGSVVREALEELNLVEEDLSEADARSVLQLLMTRSGRIGMSARLAAARNAPPAASRGERPPSSETRITRESLVAMLAPALGDAAAKKAVEDHLTALRLTEASLSVEDTGRVLEHMAGVEGILGTVARFAKARLLLRRKA